MLKKTIQGQVLVKLGGIWDSYKLTVGAEIDGLLTFQSKCGNAI